MKRVHRVLLIASIISLSILTAGCAAKLELSSLFKLSPLEVSPAICLPGDTVTVSTTLSNIGNAAGDYVAELLINGTLEKTQTFTLEPGASEAVSFTLSKNEPGQFMAQLGELTTSFTVLGVDNLSISPPEVEVDQPVTITADVQNAAETQAAYRCYLLCLGKEIEAKDITVAGGSTEKVAFTLSQDAPGMYDVELLGLSGTYKVLKPAEFEVLSVSAPTEVVAGESCTIEAEVRNVGEVDGTYTAVLKLDNSEVDTKDIAVGPGATEMVDFTCSVETAGAHTIEFDGVAKTVKALKPAELESSSLSVTPSLVLPGQESSIEAEVTNVGDVSGTFSVTLNVNGVETDSQQVTLNPGDTDTVPFTLVRNLPGTYDLGVEEHTASLTVADVETYTSEPYSYSISYPSGWTLDDSNPQDVWMVKQQFTRILVGVTFWSPGVSQEEYAELWLEESSNWAQDFNLLSRTDEVQRDGVVTGHRIDFTGTIDGIEVRGTCVLMKRGNYGFEVYADARESVYDINKPLIEACLNSFKPPTVAVGRYTNSAHGFSLNLPEGWDAVETGELTPVLHAETPVGEPLIYAYVYLERIYESTTAKEWALDVAAVFQNEQGYRIVSQGEVKLSEGTEGYEVIFTYKEDVYPIKRKVVSVIRGTQAFVVMTYSLASTYDTAQSTIDQLVRSFTLEEPKPFGASRQTSLFLAWGDIVTLDPALFEGSPAGIVGAIFSGLVRIDRDLKVVPDIAESWEVSEDGTVYTFHLREGVKFHDGKPVTARDVKYSWERACDPEMESKKASVFLGDILGAKEMLAGEAAELSGVRVIDELTLEVTIDGPKPYFLGKLAYPTAYVVDRANIARGMNWTDKPNGTGPLELKEWKKDELLILERNDDYYLEPAKLENIVLQIFAGRSMMMYEQGEIDVTGVGQANLERALDPADPLNKELLTTPGINMGYLGFNVTMPPFDDPNVRRAFALALDMDKILEVSLKGIAERASGFVPPGIPGHNEELEPLPFDPEQAEQLIAESKYGSVENLPPIVLYSLYSLSPAEEATVGMLQQNLGVAVEVQIIEEREEWLEMRHNREFQIFLTGWQADYIDPQNFLEILFHSQSEDNDSAYSNAEVDAALEKAAVERDEEARLKMYQDIEKMILEDLPVAPFYQSTKRHVLVKPYVEGYYLTPIGINIWRDLSMKPH